VKITFEGTFGEILKEMEMILGAETGKASMAAGEIAAAPVDALEDIPEVIPEVIPTAEAPQKVKKARTPKQLENDERLRAAARAKLTPPPEEEETAPEAEAPPEKVKKTRKAKAQKSDPMVPPMPPPPKTAEGMDPAEVVRIRQKTIDDLQAAYADGHQQEVFELLSRFGNGAKSFRELAPESFVPIREAIDNGALK
jgi:hypothetical protein